MYDYRVDDNTNVAFAGAWIEIGYTWRRLPGGRCRPRERGFAGAGGEISVMPEVESEILKDAEVKKILPSSRERGLKLYEEPCSAAGIGRLLRGSVD